MTTPNTAGSVATAEDFSSFLLKDTASLELQFPNGEPMLHNGQQVVVHLYGPSTQRHKDAMAAHEREAAARVFRAMGNTKKNKGEKDDPEADAKFLTAVTDRFDNFPYPGGVAAIYREPGLLYVHQQVNVYLKNLGNFFKASETT